MARSFSNSLLQRELLDTIKEPLLRISEKNWRQARKENVFCRNRSRA